MQQKSAERRQGELNGGFLGLSGTALPVIGSLKKRLEGANDDPGLLNPHFARLIENELSQKFRLVDLIDQAE